MRNQKPEPPEKRPIDFQSPKFRRLARLIEALFGEPLDAVIVAEPIADLDLDECPAFELDTFRESLDLDESDALDTCPESPVLDASEPEPTAEPAVLSDAFDSPPGRAARLNEPHANYSMRPSRLPAPETHGFALSMPALDPRLANQTVSLRHFSLATRQYMIRYQVQHSSITIEDFSAEIGINKSYYYKIVNCERRPSRDTAIAMAVCLGLTVEEAQDYLLLLGDQLNEAVKRDYLILYCLRQGYSLDETDSVLIHFDSSPLVDI